MNILSFHPAPVAAQLAGSRVCIWGIGTHGGGMAAARFCASHGAQPLLLDRSPDTHRDAAAAAGWPLAQGHVDHPWLQQADWVIVSPAIPPAVLAQLPANHAPLTCAEGWCLANHRQPRILVTGTKGKSSTAAMLGALLQWPVLGNSWTALAAAWPDQVEQPWICELSSFQLAQLSTQAPAFSSAILTTLDRDHVDWHGDLAHYHASKLDAMGWAEVVAAPPYLHPRLDQQRLLPPVSRDDWHFLAADGSVLAQGDDLPLLGRHHQDNACLALSIALHHGLAAEDCAQGLRRTPQLAHRLQIIHRDSQRTIIDDSTATTPLASRAAVASVSGPLALILGGHDKGGDFTHLWQDLRDRAATQLLLIGSCAPALTAACQEYAIPHQCCESLERAVAQGLAWIDTQPQAGTLLLAPACASFGSFQDFADRGRQFTHMVQQRLDHPLSSSSPHTT